jgi:hypothetical protein
MMKTRVLRTDDRLFDPCLPLLGRHAPLVESVPIIRIDVSLNWTYGTGDLALPDIDRKLNVPLWAWHVCHAIILPPRRQWVSRPYTN